jgi:hypothetical protein
MKSKIETDACKEEVEKYSVLNSVNEYGRMCNTNMLLM